MLIQLSLIAGAAGGRRSRLEVQAAVQVDTADPRWPGWLVETVTQHATEGARQLVAQLTPPLASAATPFVPLADVVPSAAPARFSESHS